ncbi:unnamed protein product [Allacma fusca]|uniref:Aldehyde dehydrogenase n=1 Tax=Allacma fusca TaxID=39272 RepID=A0A8J2L0V5_9HEXA|nr:unnamed protein product [Allacma fusca]
MESNQIIGNESRGTLKESPVHQCPDVAIAKKAFASGKTLPLEFRRQQLKNLLNLFNDERCRQKIMAALHQDMRKSYQEAITSEILTVKMEISKILTNFEAFLGTKRAIAAGNCVIVKPSEISKHCADVMLELLPQYLDNECYRVVVGDAEVSKSLVKHQFDYIFFTGSQTVGKQILQAGADNFTPVTLELGGKCPVYLDETACNKIGVKRILWAKSINSGQACIGPDYILCSEKVQGGKSDEKDLWIEPTFVGNVKRDDSLMSEEIFGPILPIVPVKSVDEAISFINSIDAPLVVHVFSKDEDAITKLQNSTHSGAFSVNDLILQIQDLRLPFGGKRKSGMGQYHGKHSIETFSQKRSVLTRGLTYFSEKVLEMRYPPVTVMKVRIQEFFMMLIEFMDITLKPGISHALVFFIGIFLSVMLTQV